VTNRRVVSRIRAIVSGRVQGVFFRAATARTAQALGVRGFARNLLDGTVEIVAEGEEESLERLLEWAHTGPSQARVGEVRAEWSETTGEFSGGFEIR
jgi:acylphosphatase